MVVNIFSKKQIQELSKNPFIDKVSEKAITYSEEFKIYFSQELVNGKLPTQIFREAGIKPSVLGQKRIDSFAYRIRQMNGRLEGFKDLRSKNSGRKRTKERTTEEEISYLKHQVALQKQMIEALKKTNTINRKAAKASHKKNTNLSKR